MPNPLRMLLRGQNLLGWLSSYADDVVERFVERAVAAWTCSRLRRHEHFRAI